MRCRLEPCAAVAGLNEMNGSLERAGLMGNLSHGANSKGLSPMSSSAVGHQRLLSYYVQLSSRVVLAELRTMSSSYFTGINIYATQLLALKHLHNNLSGVLPLWKEVRSTWDDIVTGLLESFGATPNLLLLVFKIANANSFLNRIKDRL